MRTAYVFDRTEIITLVISFFFSSRRRHTISNRDWSSDVCSSDLAGSLTGKSGSIRTVPVNHSAGPFADACEPLRWIFILSPWRSKLDHYLDRFAVVHREVAVGHAVEIRDAGEYFARLDSSL